MDDANLRFEKIDTRESKPPILISGSTLKIIAIVCMVIDHIGAAILEKYLMIGKVEGADNSGSDGLILFDGLLRLIGRISFPIFIFLLVEGFKYTKSKWKYLLRMLVFALVSEIPFDMAFNLTSEEIKGGKIIDFGYQNVFFTLSIGLLAIIIIEMVYQLELSKNATIFFVILISAGFIMLGFMLKIDYAGIGVAAIILMYVFRDAGSKAMLLVCGVLIIGSGLLEVTSLLAMIPISKYNGKRGIDLKYFFYGFYPVHLLILALIGLAMGI